jgi:putative transposase
VGLSVRTFWCEACGYEAGRDRNPARTILATADGIRADGDDIRHLLLPSQDVKVRSESEIPWS